MEESIVKKIERGMDMCEDIKRYLLENKICESNGDVIEFFVLAVNDLAVYEEF